MAYSEFRRSKKRRSRFDLTAAILKALMSESLTAYQMIFHLNLNAKRANKYLEELRQKGLVELRRDGKISTYVITPKGIDWLNDYLKLIHE
ncbi:MAG: ArsR family transcriptional regulator [Thaumarchaeota archaeon]|nr:ArsR family transcriptional regulator [Nitrososphaerota archaeon]